ncbi:MAG: exodeoxyribonuclease VII large subunit [Actinomycetota bacterium]|nr:exodeoxyribonuclease VII large subunit [Actinomycetota bacterium]
MGLTSSAEQPLPVRTVARTISDWVGRLGRIWVEGQVTEVSRRPGAATVFLTLRDPVADVSLRLTCARAICEAIQPPLADGARVVVWAKPDFYLARGSLTMTVFDIRPVGVGELLARLERLKAILSAEGLFDADRKRPLPFLPRTVGLVCGRGSAAERDVLENARRRWPAVAFAVRPVAVQGPSAVTSVIAAVRELDRDPAVDVIVIARGGGSVEDLLPFSDESLCRAVVACLTPVVSAIGHEPDMPLLDLVADRRASTPTDAGKLVVPDVGEQATRIAELRARARRTVMGRLDRELAGLLALRSRPVLAEPGRDLTARAADVAALRERAGRSVSAALAAAAADLFHTRARVAALSPAATLERGYAVVQRHDGQVVRGPGDVEPAERLQVRLADGRLAVTVAGP